MGCFKSKQKSTPKALIVEAQLDDPVPFRARGNSFKINLKEIKPTEILVDIDENNGLSFSIFYKRNRVLIKNLLTKEKLPDSVCFEERIAQYYGIDLNLAYAWVENYVDYILLLSWQIVQNKNQAFCSPFAIQMVTRVHLLYQSNYEQCFKILNSKEMIHFAPYKAVVSKNLDHLSHMLEVYNRVKKMLFVSIHDNPDIQKTDDQRKQAEIIWEPFELTIMKNEFSFWFSSNAKKQHFISFLLENQDSLCLDQPNYDLILEYGNKLRKVYGKDSLDSKYTIPNIILSCKARPTGNVLYKIMQIDSLSFPDEFVKILCWENLLTLNETVNWILEYKKFLYLLSIENEYTNKIVPFGKIEKVWRLHMQFTEAYQISVGALKSIRSYRFVQESQISYKETKQLYNQMFKNDNPEIWADEISSDSSTFGIFHVFFNKDILSENPVIISQFLEYQKKKKKSLKYCDDPKFLTDVLLNNNIYTLLTLDRDFFDINYETEMVLSGNSNQTKPKNNKTPILDDTVEDNNDDLKIKLSDMMDKYNEKKVTRLLT